MKTPFEIAQEQVKNKQLNTPSVTVSGKEIDYFGYQLAVHRMNLRVMSSGMTFRGIKFTDIKRYYGLKGKSAKACLEEFDKIVEDYKKSLK